MEIVDKLDKAIDELSQIANNIEKNQKLEGAADVNSTTVRPMSRMRSMEFATKEQTDMDKLGTKVFDIIGDILRE